MAKESYIEKVKLINNSFKTKQFMPFYFLYGEEKYYLVNIKKSALSNFEDDTKLNIRIYDKTNFNIDEVIKYVSNMPIMNEKKLIIFEDIDYFKNKKSNKSTDNDGFIEIIDKNKDINIIIILNTETESGYAKYYSSNEYVEYFKKNGIVLDLSKLNDKDLFSMVESRFKKHKISINKLDIAYFINICGNDLLNLYNEIDKIAAYVGDKKVATRKDIDSIVTQNIDDSVFTLIELYNEKKQEKALKFYGDIMSDGSYNKNAVFSMFANQFSNLIICKDLMLKNKGSTEIAESMGLPLWKVNKLISANKYTNIENLKIKLKEITNLSIDKINGDINDDHMLILLMDKV